MASNYQLRKALYKQIKSKDLTVKIAVNNFFRLVKLDDDKFLLNIDIQTNKGNITIKGLTKDNVNSYNTTSDIELSVDADNIVYVKNASETETIIRSTGLELVKGILNESYFDPITTDPGADIIFNSKTDQGTFDLVDVSSSRINSDVSSFSDRLYVHGESVLNNKLTVNGKSVLNDTLIVNSINSIQPINETTNSNLVIGFSNETSSSTTTIRGKLEIEGKDLTINGITKYDHIEAETIKGTGGITGEAPLLIQGPSNGDLTLKTNEKMVNIESNTSITGTLGVSGAITGNLTGNADTATKLSTSGSAGQFWGHNNTWIIPVDDDTVELTWGAGTETTGNDKISFLSKESDSITDAKYTTLVAGTNVAFNVETAGQLTISSTDTKNTAGASNTSYKIFLVGATDQSTNPQTYTDDEVFVTNGKLDAREINTSGNATIGGSLTVAGSIIANNVEMVSTSNGVIFKGTTNDDFETALSAINPTAYRSIKLPNASGTIALIENLPEGKGIKIEESSLVWDSESESLKFVFT